MTTEAPPKATDEHLTRAVNSMVWNVENNQHSPHAVPKLIEDLRQDLTQSLGLGILSMELYVKLDAELADALWKFNKTLYSQPKND